MKALVAIESCRAHAGLNHFVRESWLKGRDVDYRFFMGRGETTPMDEVALNCDDDYVSLPFKTQALLRWSLDRDYDFVFKCDTDTYVCVPRLLASGFERYDYSGYFIPCVSCERAPSGHCRCILEGGRRCYSYASGGSGYWLSRRAMEIVVSTEFITDVLRERNKSETSSRGEDLQVGWALGDAGVECRLDERYRLRWPSPRADNDIITLHDNTLQIPLANRLAFVHSVWVSSGGK